MAFTKSERLALKILVKKELHQIETQEKKFKMIEVNSPPLSSLLLKDKDIPFLATQERYHQFLLKLDKKL
ncbi:hypothetical protein ACFLZB_00980 [Nanoarchaeota archaeon]